MSPTSFEIKGEIKRRKKKLAARDLFSFGFMWIMGRHVSLDITEERSLHLFGGMQIVCMDLHSFAILC